MRLTILSLAIAASAALSAPVALAQDYITNYADIVKAANWDAMETVNIELSEHDFEPNNLTLKAGKPYRLVITNKGKDDHYYTAPEFFRSVAWRKVMSARPHGGEIKAPYFTAFEVFKKSGVVELYFVTVNKGTFDVICTIDDHKEKGMTGKIKVE